MVEADPCSTGIDNGGLDAAKDADAVVIVTEWDAFRALNLEQLAKTMKGNALVDLRNIYQPSEVAKSGLEYTTGLSCRLRKTFRLRQW